MPETDEEAVCLPPQDFLRREEAEALSFLCKESPEDRVCCEDSLTSELLPLCSLKEVLLELREEVLQDLTFEDDDRRLRLSEAFRVDDEVVRAVKGVFLTGSGGRGTGKRCGGILSATQVIFSSVSHSLLTLRLY